ncbi:MAG: hypothetical protein H6816_09840 [Phycisphaerales bacterium]|nr:hypothetical protein [Phycisphaerales bacterium]
MGVAKNIGMAESYSPDEHEDDELSCPMCGYSLTGLTSTRCPECGSPFNRAELLGDVPFVRAPEPIPLWDERGRSGTAAAYVNVAIHMLFGPGPFASTFPPNPDWSSGRRYGRYSYALAAALMFSAAIAAGSTGAGRYAFVAAWLIGAYTCETLVALMLPRDRSTAPTIGSYYFSRPRSIACMGSCFLVLSSVVIATGFLTAEHDDAWLPDRITHALLALTLWWWGAFTSIAIHTAGKSGWVMVISIPGAVLVGFAAGLVAFFPIGIAVMWILGTNTIF